MASTTWGNGNEGRFPPNSFDWHPSKICFLLAYFVNLEVKKMQFIRIFCIVWTRRFLECSKYPGWPCWKGHKFVINAKTFNLSQKYIILINHQKSFWHLLSLKSYSASAQTFCSPLVNLYTCTFKQKQHNLRYLVSYKSFGCWCWTRKQKE